MKKPRSGSKHAFRFLSSALLGAGALALAPSMASAKESAPTAPAAPAAPVNPSSEAASSPVLGLDAGIRDLLRQAHQIVRPAGEVLADSAEQQRLRALLGDLNASREGWEQMAPGCFGLTSAADTHGRQKPLYFNSPFKVSPQYWATSNPLFTLYSDGIKKDSIQQYFELLKFDKAGIDVKSVPLPDLVSQRLKSANGRVSNSVLEAQIELYRLYHDKKISTEELKARYDALKSLGTTLTKSEDPYTSPFALFVLSKRMNEASNDQEVLKPLKELAPHWTLEQKVGFLRKMGGMMNEHYDYARSDQIVAATNEVGMVELVQTILSGDKTKKAGVCRDIASAMGKMAEALGFEKPRVLSYNSTKPHVTLLLRDPQNPGRVIKINYGNIADAASGIRGEPAIQEDDQSVVHYLHVPNGATVGHLLTERGAILEKGAGGKAQDIDPFWIDQSPFLGTVNQVNRQDERKKDSFFVGAMGDGSPILGVGRSQSSGDRDAAGYQHEEGGAFAMDSLEGMQNLASFHLFGRHRSQYNTPWLPQTKETATRLEADVAARADVSAMLRRSNVFPVSAGFDIRSIDPSFSSETAPGILSGDGGVLGTVAVRTRVDNPEKGTRADVRVGTQVGLGLDNIAVANLAAVRPYQNLVFATLEAKQQISPELQALLNLMGGIRDLGPQARVEAGVQEKDGKWQVKGLVQGALSQDSMNLAPGMAPEAQLTAETGLQDQKTQVVEWIRKNWPREMPRTPGWPKEMPPQIENLVDKALSGSRVKITVAHPLDNVQSEDRARVRMNWEARF